MKRLRDLSVFQPIPEILSESFGTMSYYLRRSRKEYCVRSLYFEKREKQLLYTSLITEVHLLAGACFRRRNAPYLSVECVRDGTLYVRQRNEAYRLEPGEIFLMQPDLDGEFLVGESGFCKKESFSIFGTLLPGFLQKSGLDQENVIGGINSSPVHRIFQHLGTLEGIQTPAALQENSQLTFELLYYLSSPGHADFVPKKLLDLKTYMADTLEQEHSIQELASLYGCSPYHLTRLFQRFFHQTPYRMLIEFRMKAAAEILRREQEISIKEVTGMVGYQNALNFSTEFRKYFGMSPREYQKYIDPI